MTTTITSSLFFASLGSAALGWLMFLLSVFLILLVLVQRGKGGGLTGALGGPGGQSAFGSKAGDTFTLITAVSAIIWGLVCAIAMYTLGVPPLTADDLEYETDQPPTVTSPADAASGQSPAAAGGASGLSGLSDFLSEEPQADGESEPASEAGEPGTPSLELTPAEPAGEPQAGETPADSTPADAGETSPDTENAIVEEVDAAESPAPADVPAESPNGGQAEAGGEPETPAAADQ